MMSPLPMQWMGTLREHYVILFGTAGTFGLMAGFVGSWIGGWMGGRRAVRSAQFDMPTPNGASRLQLMQLSQMVEAIAIEVERVAEGQRFATRLLAERAASNATPELRT
jgi:hypothetical protein